MATDGFFKHYPDYAPGEKPSHLQKPKDTGKAKFQKRHKDQVTSEEVFMRIESDHEHQFVFIPTEPGMVEAWRKDPSIPLAQVVGVFEVFVRRGSTRGSYDHPSTGELQNWFGTSDMDAVIRRLLLEGTIQDKQDEYRQA